MDTLEHERICEVRTVRDSKHARPQLVVLTLQVRGVVPQTVCFERLASDEHRRVEEGRAEEREPANGPRADRIAVQCSGASSLVEIEDRRTENSQIAHAPHLTLQALPQRHVVRVESGEKPSLRTVEGAVERSGKAELVVVSHHDQPRIGDPGEELGRVVGRRVVHDDQLEIGERLAQHALHGERQVASIVVRCQEN